MADGYARLSGRPGFAYGQYGPGVANVAAALAEAWWARSPVISLTSSTRTVSRRRFEYQELDELAMNTPVTVFNQEAVLGPGPPTSSATPSGPPWPSPVSRHRRPDRRAPRRRGEIEYRDKVPVPCPPAGPIRPWSSGRSPVLRDASRPLVLAGAGLLDSSRSTSSTAS